jgi:hypothetical protein
LTTSRNGSSHWARAVAADHRPTRATSSNKDLNYAKDLMNMARTHGTSYTRLIAELKFKTLVLKQHYGHNTTKDRDIMLIG